MKFRLLAAVFVFGIAAVLLGWIYEAQLKSPPTRVDLTIPDNIDYYLTNMKYRVIDDDGRLDYEFSSPRLEHFPHNDSSQIDSPIMQIYRNQEQWQLDSQYGEFQHLANLVRFERDVVLQKSGEDAMRLTTQTMLFEPDRDLVTIDSDMIMLTGSARIEAQRGVFNLADKVYSLKNTRAIYHDK